MMIKLFSNTPLHLNIFPLFSQRLSLNPLAWKSPTSHIHWETAINISKLAQTPKNPETLTDAPNTDDNDYADDDTTDAPNATENDTGLKDSPKTSY